MSSKKITISRWPMTTYGAAGFPHDSLESQPDMEIVGEAGNGREAVELAALLAPDVVVMDVAMPELNGIEATRRLIGELAAHARTRAQSCTRTRCMFARFCAPARADTCLKDASTCDLLGCRAGRRARGRLSQPGVSDAVLSDYRQHVTDPIDLLTSREREVLQMIAEGKTNKEIADDC